ncbi:glycosyltransferase family 1 protein [Soonwooa sp.]|uniref:glycosyltransferase family 4 protein n=1 Tax=Soonwooa sp. TaxID=1938592 RepID=UPI00261E4CBD|nr:glycosyltransferase family 1 protein [Soonwooa sp.]
MRKKILIDLERLRYPYSGIANVFRNLRAGLEANNCNLDLSFFGKFANSESQRQWQKWHKFYENFSDKYDIVHVSHQLSSYFQKDYKKTIKILTLHDLNFLHENLSDSKKEKMLTKVNNNVKNADYIVFISEYAKTDFEKNQQLFKLNKLKAFHVIHNGIKLPDAKDYDLGQFEFLKQKKYILNIGVLFDKKNQISLVRMLPYINEDLVLLASAEKEPYASEVRATIKELNLADRVHFLRNVSEEEKYALIQNCEAMCHPSIAEGFGIPPIEAMAFGKAVFLSKYTSLPEIGGDAAYYFDNFEAKQMAEFYQDKMKFYHENKVLEENKIKDWAKQFDYKVMAFNYLEFYSKVLR